jgi:hypothetical protein
MNIQIDMNMDITEIQIFEIGFQFTMILGMDTRHGHGHGYGQGYGHSEIECQMLAKMVKFNPPSPSGCRRRT